MTQGGQLNFSGKYLKTGYINRTWLRKAEMAEFKIILEKGGNILEFNII